MNEDQKSLILKSSSHFSPPP
ncbi:hypothetical protein CICLE_v100311242mg, partial [Citrus x clementina]